MKKIVILDAFVAASGGLSWDEISQLGELTAYDRTEPQDTLNRCKGAFAVFTNKVLMTREIIEQLPELRFIGVLATGYNNVDIDAATEHGVTVCNVPAYSTESVVQTVFAHILNLMVDVERHSQSVKAGDWSNCADFSYLLSPTEELFGKTLGIYGIGNIGRRVAEIAHAFGMKIIALTSKSQEQLPQYITRVNQSELFALSDVISLNAPLTADNANFICEGTLAMMKPTAVLINTARGGLIDESALDKALRSRRIFAAALDVLCKEPPSADNPLLSNPYCRITPHIAWQSTTARRRLISVSAQNLRAFLDGMPTNVINR
ncbi:MAG: D-2-hydroxyacid dehydrogenase [Muribaculaceae bacterium]